MPKHYSAGSRTPHAQLESEIREALTKTSPQRATRAPCHACGGDEDRGLHAAACPRHHPPGYQNKPPVRAKRAHATRARSRSSGLKAYRSLVQKAVARCVQHPRANHSLYECVFEEVHGGAPFPTPKMRDILENEVHKARPGSLHATRKKLDPHEAKQRLKAEGIVFSNDFHELPRSQVQLLVDAARSAGYRKRKDAPGSTARMYFQYLSRLR